MIEDRINKAIENRVNTDDNYSEGIDKCWEELSDVLSEDEQVTIDFLENCTEEQLYWISEVFEEISMKLQSKKFIDCIKKLEKKFPQLDLAHDIEVAESYI